MKSSCSFPQTIHVTSPVTDLSLIFAFKVVPYLRHHYCWPTPFLRTWTLPSHFQHWWKKLEGWRAGVQECTGTGHRLVSRSSVRAFVSMTIKNPLKESHPGLRYNRYCRRCSGNSGSKWCTASYAITCWFDYLFSRNAALVAWSLLHCSLSKRAMKRQWSCQVKLIEWSQ